VCNSVVWGAVWKSGVQLRCFWGQLEIWCATSIFLAIWNSRKQGARTSGGDRPSGTDMNRVAAARTTVCYRKSVPGTTKHTVCSRTHTHEHQGLWRKTLGSQLGNVLGTKGGPVQRRRRRSTKAVRECPLLQSGPTPQKLAQAQTLEGLAAARPPNFGPSGKPSAWLAGWWQGTRRAASWKQIRS
jgi:hypothetical protein